MFTRLVESPEPLTLGELSRQMPFSRQAARKHITQLVHADLVSTHQVGRRVFCQANPARLRDVHSWVERYESFWSSAVDELTRYVEFRKQLEDE